MFKVWDHETKDFKVLYKPLYCCHSKPGSFEAHHLAVSTFERWQRKFIPVSNCRLMDLPKNVQHHLVSSNCISRMTAGNESLPLESTPYAPSMMKSSGRIIVEAQSCPDVVGNGELMCRSVSGFGTRSLTPYYVMDFSSKFQDIIQKGLKRATTRVLKPDVEGGEPQLMNLVYALSITKDGVLVQAVSDDHATHPPCVFASLLVSSVERSTFANLTQELAEIEQFTSLEEFRDCLREFYPWITDDDELWIFFFDLI